MFQDVSRKVKLPAGPSTFCFVHGRRILWHIQIRFLSIYLLQIITSSTTTIHCSNELPHCIVLPCPICLLAPDDMVFFWYWFLFVFWFEMILNFPFDLPCVRYPCGGNDVNMTGMIDIVQELNILLKLSKTERRCSWQDCDVWHLF